jgi:signal transduction histidine kinase
MPLSGWYWQGERPAEAAPRRRASRSLWDRDFPYLDPSIPLNDAGLRQGYVAGPDEQRLRVLERPIDLGGDGKYVVAVAGDATEISEETRAFNLSLTGTFAALTFVLLVSTLFQVTFGLAPLKRISQSLAAIRSGKAERLEGTFPDEIAPLARETNELLEANREIVERARTHVGNLAHALKTPLSVIVNEASANADNPFAGKVAEQAAVMREQVTRHLERARIAARLTVVGTETEVAPVIDALCRTMEKIHRSAGVAIDQHVEASMKFPGEQQDLEEMVGNLVDNACKWARSRVSIEVIAVEGALRPMMRILVDDDGRGLSAEEREQVAHRGRRLDETKPGSGLGLSIVVDLAQLYRGSLILGDAPIGGLRAELILPRV